MTEYKWWACMHTLIYVMFLLEVECLFVNITYVEDAVAKGAGKICIPKASFDLFRLMDVYKLCATFMPVCLDGSPPAYHLSPGFGAGVNSWLVHMEVDMSLLVYNAENSAHLGLQFESYRSQMNPQGGGWCNNVTSCLARKSTRLGSSKQMLKQLAFSGILSDEKAFNPDFYNWNKVKVRYCDGSSFTGDIERVDPETKLHYRGARVWLAVMDDLLAKGMNNAENSLISGCSAGGLTSMLHCDSFRALLPMGANVKCLSDAGYFVNVKDISEQEHIRAFFVDVVTTHGSAKNLPASCTSRLAAPSMCFFPQYGAHQIQTPLFILNAAYDSWQIKNILVPGLVDRHGTWHECKLDIKNCSPDQLQTMQGFRKEFLNALAAAGNSASRGFFINSCYVHCQSEMQETWYGPDSPVLGKIPIANAVGTWFYDRSPFQKIDCPYPCDSSCPNQPIVNNTSS